MTSDRTRHAVEPSADSGHEAPRQTTVYARVAELLRKALQEGHMEAGTVILEGPVAELLQSTRTPVRQALLQLEEEGLVHRFDGRGFLAGSLDAKDVPPRRMALTPAMLGIDGAGAPVRKLLGWKAIYDDVEREMVHLSVFGRYRVNELELARQFGVGRLVARDVLLRMEGLGLLEKDARQRWVVNALDATRLNHLYELRWLLEPVALGAAAARAPAAELKSMADELKQTMRSYPRVTRKTLDKLEHDLHVRLLAHCPNTDLLHSLQRTRCVLTLCKHVLGVSAPMPAHDPFMAEHLQVLEAAVAGDTATAQALLRQHLEGSCAKVSERADWVRTTYAMPNLSYVSDC